MITKSEKVVNHTIDFTIGVLAVKAEWKNGILSVEVVNDDHSRAALGLYTCLKGGMWFSLKTMDFVSGDTVLDRTSGTNLHMIGQKAVELRYKKELTAMIEEMA